jgi:glycosyltransferase involved in cell wall biosynthesis
LVSCLCVTEAREPFHPWLLWNYEKQDYPFRELVVVDSSPREGRWPAGVEVVRCAPGTTVGRKRNLAVEAAHGDVLAFFDDDDWQHPRRLSLLVCALAGGIRIAGAKRSWFVDLARGRARAHAAQRGVIFNGLGVRRSALAGVRFDEDRPRAADTAWMSAVARESRCDPAPLGDLLSFWLCHTANVSNQVSRYVFSHSLDAVRADAGPGSWGHTDGELARLRDRSSK